MPARKAAVPSLRERLAIAVLAGVLGLMMVVEVAGGGLAERLENASFDWRLRLRGPLVPGPEVIIVAIDDTSVARLGRWPPPREALAAAVAKLDAAGAAVVALNLIMSEPGGGLSEETQRALEHARAQLPDDAAELRAELNAVLGAASPDRGLADTIAATGRVVLPYAFVPEAHQASVEVVPEWVRVTAVPVVAETPGRPVLDLPGSPWLLAPTASLGVAAATLGHVNSEVDADGGLRHHAPALRGGDAVLPCLAVETARLFMGVERLGESFTTGEAFTVGERTVPLDWRSRQVVNAYGPTGTFETVSLADLLSGELAPDRFRGRIVLLGATAAGVGDRFATAFTGRLPGTEQLATIIDNILHGRVLVRNDATRLADGLVVVALAVFGAFAAGRRSPARSVAVVLVGSAAWSGLAYAALVHQGWWLAIVAPVASLGFAGILAELVRTQREQSRRRALERQRANLARYFSPQVAERLAALDRPFEGDRTEVAAVMFVDLVGFTSVAQRLAPQAAMGVLREFHTLVEQAVFAHGGFVEGFMGDGAMAAFGVPEHKENASCDALHAARDLVVAADGWNTIHAARGSPVPRVSIGLHAGPVLMGDIGGRRQFQFTVIGDTVNAASRLESLTRRFDCAVLASDALIRWAVAFDREAARGFEPIEEVELRGREGPMRAWRLPRRAAASITSDASAPAPLPRAARA